MKIGMLSLGQTPRVDLIPALEKILGPENPLVEVGALDGYTVNDLIDMDVQPDDYVLVTRMRDGTEVKFTKRFIIPLLQEKLDQLEDQGVRLTVIMCTGKFPAFQSRGLVITPQEILQGVIKATLKKGRLGIIFPTPEQISGAEDTFGTPGLEIYSDMVSPYMPGEMDGLCERLKKQNLDLILLNCFGFTEDVKTPIQKATGVPTLQSNTLIGRVLLELAS
jgi:protein AroM